MIILDTKMDPHDSQYSFFGFAISYARVTRTCIMRTRIMRMYIRIGGCP